MAKRIPQVLCGCLLVFPGLLAAHDLEAVVTMAAPAVIVKTAYGGSTPAAFVKIQVYSPSEPSQEFQTGHTDRRGYFSFVPEGGGNWRVVVDDEEGHRREVIVPVPNEYRGSVDAPPASVSRWERAILGIGMILGLTGMFYGFKARSRLT